MWHQDLYVSEKLAEFERTRRNTVPASPSPERPKRRIVGPVVRAAGRRVRRAGEALEAWGAPRPATGS